MDPDWYDELADDDDDDNEALEQAEKEDHQLDQDASTPGKYVLREMVQHTVPNRSYPLTRFEKAKVLSARARIINKLLSDFTMTEEQLRTLERMELRYFEAENEGERSKIRETILQFQQQVFGPEAKRRREKINLTDEELQDATDPIEIAKLEYKYRRLPMLLERRFPDGEVALLDVNVLIAEPKTLFQEAYESLPALRLDEPF